MTEGIIETFGAAFGLSLLYNLVPGPVSVEAFQRGARRGARAVLSVRLGSLIGSLIWAVAGLAGVGVAVRNPHCRVLLGVAGTTILLTLAARALRPTRPADRPDASPSAARGDLLAGALIALASPLEAAFWLGIGGVALSGNASRLAGAGAFVAGFVVADLLCTVAFAAVVGWGRGLAGERVVRTANLLCGVTMLWFALTPLVRAV